MGEIESLSKTTKLLLLDSLLQEVCIESGSDVSHNLLYSGLKKAHSKRNPSTREQPMFGNVLWKFRSSESSFLLPGSLLNCHMRWRNKMIVFFHHTKGFGCPLEKSRHAGRDGGHGGAADDCSSDVAAGCRRMALGTVTWASLKFVNFLASAISSGTKYSWMRVIGGQKCCCFNFGF